MFLIAGRHIPSMEKTESFMDACEPPEILGEVVARGQLEK
jgi:hypothetical protein